MQSEGERTEPQSSGPPPQRDLRWVVSSLTRRRESILTSWLDAVAVQPFHAGRRERAVADHILRLYDALVAFLVATIPSELPPHAPPEDPQILDAARLHAKVRTEQGLQPPDIVVEFRILRQQILVALREDVPGSADPGDVLMASLLVNDALDLAITVGLRALVDLVESVREDFLATTIHDVRQPLTAIKGYAQMAEHLLHGTPAEIERLSEALKQVATLTDWMTELLDRLRDASRIALHTLDLDLGTVPLASLFEAATERLGPEDRQRVRLTLAPGLDTRGEWDALRLSQVINNLLSNAVKYSPPGSPITITVGGNADEMEFAIRDEGIGIPESELARVFQRYVRAPSAVERGIEGLGLGLYLSKGIVETHGGEIWATSEGPGLGSTFHVRLPRRPPLGSSATE